MKDADRFNAALGQILELVVLLNEDMSKSFARDGLTSARAHLLWELGQRGPSTQRDLAEALNVSARNITGLVDGLVAGGFVTREPHPKDRRATHVSFTEHGQEVAEQMGRDQQEFSRLLFASMPDKQFDCFVKGMGEVLARLREAGLTWTHEEEK
ncbi:MAG TPA: MarR family transcriptional regulator [Micromonosporaceae bacterium]|nr:MarR family transcriptional regulator [Micromonosporaceae bacterium]